MCFLAIYVNNDASADEYQLIIANNRDESYKRPTESVSFWGNNGSCISSIDKAPGREGGTWLGMNKNGKLAAVLNILGINDLSKMGKGHLTVNFLNSNVTASDYLESVDKLKELYKEFQLVLLERSNEKYHIYFLTNSKDVYIPPLELDPDSVHIFTNSTFSKPWKKNERGYKIFSETVEEFNKISERDVLIEKIFDKVLNDTTTNIPDPVLQEQMNLEFKRDTSKLSKICVHEYEDLGSRTKTVILVDGKGCCEYIEKSMVNPLISQYDNKLWETKIMKFDIE